MYAEITKKTFNKLIDENIPLKGYDIERKELAEKHYYNIGDDTVLLSIINYVSCTTQYYIRDINA
mgnify:CR=1 FL=1|jgi:hypothetical protein|tara:strand:+ start:47 stop:241 length:195 start_codon:yes stop_codon:yes gene_type:complete